MFTEFIQSFLKSGGHLKSLFFFLNSSHKLYPFCLVCFSDDLSYFMRDTFLSFVVSDSVFIFICWVGQLHLLSWPYVEGHGLCRSYPLGLSTIIPHGHQSQSLWVSAAWSACSLLLDWAMTADGTLMGGASVWPSWLQCLAGYCCVWDWALV